MLRISLSTAALAVGMALAGPALVGCGSARPTSDGGSSTSAEAGTSGGEAEAPRTLYTTTPVPVPQPAVPRDTLAQPVQQTWLEVEQGIAARPPEPPAADDEGALEAWYTGAFAPWLAGRVAAGQRAEEHANELESAPAHERGVVAGLLGYFHEQTAAEARGAPIPASIVSDAELLDIYSRSLDEALAPLALRSAEAYRFCMAAFDELDEAQRGAWQEWRAWCGDRGGEVVRVYSRRTGEGGGGAAAQPAGSGEAP
jgi:hypothetical protein